MGEILAGAGHGSYLNHCTLAEYFSGSGGVGAGVPGPGVTILGFNSPGVAGSNILALPEVDIMKWLSSPGIGDMGDFFDGCGKRGGT